LFFSRPSTFFQESCSPCSAKTVSPSPPTSRVPFSFVLSSLFPLFNFFFSFRRPYFPCLDCSSKYVERKNPPPPPFPHTKFSFFFFISLLFPLPKGGFLFPPMFIHPRGAPLPLLSRTIFPFPQRSSKAFRALLSKGLVFVFPR